MCSQTKMNGGKDLAEVAKLFLKLGFISFGGPAAHIAMMEDEVVRKRKWITPEHFLDLIGATNLIPGPNSTEMTMHCGHERAGVKGLFVAGFCFILPAVVITAVFAWLYQLYGQLPEVEPYIYGIKPAVIAIIVGAIYALGKKALKSVQLGMVGAVVLIVTLLGISEIAALLGAGVAGILLYLIRNSGQQTARGLLPYTLLHVAGSSLADISQLKLFWIFLKVGAVLYRSGYVLFALLDGELVATGILTRQQLIDAVAVGQFTPGPVLSTATFIGWQIGGLPGALLATLGIFLPSFFFVLLLNPLIPRMRNSGLMAAFLNHVNVASVAVIVAVAVTMSRDTLTDWRTIVIAVVSLAVTFGYKKLNSAFIVGGGALLGYILTLL